MKIYPIIISAMLVFFALFALIFMVSIVSDGEVGVRNTLGSYNPQELGTGIALSLPLITDIYKVNTKFQHIEETALVPSSEGLSINVDVSIIYAVKPDRASEIYQTVSDNIKDTLLVPYVRNGIRDIVSGYTSEAVYTEEKRGEIAAQLKKYLEGKVGNDLIIHDVLLRQVTLPDTVKQAIDLKISAKQVNQRKESELEIAKKDAEIEIAKANGTAQSNRIIANSITDNYLKWKFISTLDNSNAQIIYVPTEANLPVLEANRFRDLAIAK